MNHETQSKNQKSRHRTQQIYAKIRDRICLLQYEPGALLSENELAEEFEVSRTPIRRVLQHLEHEGLVISRRGIGTIVTSVDVRSLKEVYALRIKLAELIGELCAPPDVTKDDLKLLESLIDKCRTLRVQRDPVELGKINLALSQVIIRNISNRPLQEVFERLFYQTARVWQQILIEMDWAREVDIMIDEIKQTRKALEDGDTNKLGQLRRNDIAMCLDRLLRHYFNFVGIDFWEKDAPLPTVEADGRAYDNSENADEKQLKLRR